MKSIGAIFKKIAVVVGVAGAAFCAVNYTSMHKCTKCGRRWHGNAYYGVDKKEILCDECAYEYWHPQRYENHKKRPMSKRTRDLH